MPVGLHNPCSHLHVLTEPVNPLTNLCIRLTKYENIVVILKAIGAYLSS